MAAREFHIGDVLSVYTGVLVSRRHFDGVEELLEFMAEDGVWITQVSLATRVMQRELLAQLPWLAGVETPVFAPEGAEVPKERVYAWVDSMAALYGETHEVVSAPEAWRKPGLLPKEE